MSSFLRGAARVFSVDHWPTRLKKTKELGAEIINFDNEDPVEIIKKEKPVEMGIAVGILVAILIFTMFIVGYDQGQLFSIAQGQQAFDNMYIHEFAHDMRHAAGFPCH